LLWGFGGLTLSIKHGTRPPRIPLAHELFLYPARVAMRTELLESMAEQAIIISDTSSFAHSLLRVPWKLE
jgi:hypothetical protein